jgi:hypothetical protein
LGIKKTVTGWSKAGITLLVAFIIFVVLKFVPFCAFAGDPDTLTELLKTLGPIGVFLEFLRAMGLPGAVIIIWYIDRRDLQAVLAKYKKDMDETREMYKSNVHLVEATQEIGKNYCNIADDLKDIIIMNTQSNMLLHAELKGRKNGRRRQ